MLTSNPFETNPWSKARSDSEANDPRDFFSTAVSVTVLCLVLATCVMKFSTVNWRSYDVDAIAMEFVHRCK